MAAPTIINPESIVALMMAELDDDPSLKPPLLRSLLTDESCYCQPGRNS